jgi:hypothetical protein
MSHCAIRPYAMNFLSTAYVAALATSQHHRMANE